MMLDAEFADLSDKPIEAEKHFECAVLRAERRQQIGDVAKCEQRYGEFLLRRNKAKEASPHLQRAATLYDEWGAHAVGNEMRKRHPEFTCPIPSFELMTPVK